MLRSSFTRYFYYYFANGSGLPNASSSHDYKNAPCFLCFRCVLILGRLKLLSMRGVVIFIMLSGLASTEVVFL